MKSKPFGAIFGLLALVAIMGVVPAFGQASSNQSGIPLGPPYTAPAGNVTTTGMSGSNMSGMTMLSAKASDGTIITVSTSGPTSGQPLTLTISFTDANGNKIQHQNYAIAVIQDGNSVLSNSAGHTHTGDDTQTSSTNLSSSDPVNIQITLNGIGLPTADPSTWTGVKGEVLSFSQVTSVAPRTTMSNMTTTPAGQNAPGNQSGIPLGAPYTAGNATVPEFGPVASIVLAIAILSIVVFAAKTRVIPRL
jgi:predicted secreted protein with PEFG-CTERM motif